MPRAVLELQPSEVDRLRHDLMNARQAIESGLALMRRYEDVLKRTQALLGLNQTAAEKAMDLADRFAALGTDLEPAEKLCPAPTEPVNVRWVYRAPQVD